jgi:hypothetical protein
MSSASATTEAQVADDDDHMWGSELTEESDPEDDRSGSIKRNLDGKPLKRKLGSKSISSR